DGSPAPPPAAPAPDSSIASAALNAVSYSNPGPWESLSSDAKRLVSLDAFDGARVDVNRQLSPAFAVNHNWWMGTQALPGGKTYTFSAQFVPSPSSFCMARVTADGQTEGRIHALLSGDPSSSNVTSKLVVVTSPGQAGGNDQSVLELDAAQPSWTGNLKLGSMAGGDYLSLSFLQAVTPRLSLGGDASYIGVQSASAASYGARYAAPSWTAALQYSGMQGAVAASYRKVVTRDRVSLGAELQFSPQTMDSNVVLAGEFNT
ncbi:hypothetical protein TeGR_g11456, partial [Tetraparma gracilis]